MGINKVWLQDQQFVRSVEPAFVLLMPTKL
jgi:hypothetical protein